MSWDYYDRPYVSAADRRRKAEQAAKALMKEGETVEPIAIAGNKIAKTFWGKAWCDNLEAYSDYANRLPRGRTYVRNGSVIDLKIKPGTVTALVQGSELYKITIKIDPLNERRWRVFKKSAAGKVTNLLDLLQGRLSKDVLTEATDKRDGLFPTPDEIKLQCSCPDWADMCKHVAAALYGVGARLDEKPELFFVLRGVDAQELIVAASETAAAPLSTVEGAGLEGEDLSALFGVEIEASAPAAPAAKVKKAAPPKPKKATRKPAAKPVSKPSRRKPS